MKKLSFRHILIDEINRRGNIDTKILIEKMRKIVKKDSEVIKKFKEYGVPIDEIDNVFISFCELPVSAKTKDMKIYLNEKMLESDLISDPTHYLVHELVHYLQQRTGKNNGVEQKNEDYLDRPSEEEAFESQVDFKRRKESPEEANRYVEDLLDYHGFEGREKKEKKEDIL